MQKTPTQKNLNLLLCYFLDLFSKSVNPAKCPSACFRLLCCSVGHVVAVKLCLSRDLRVSEVRGLRRRSKRRETRQSLQPRHSKCSCLAIRGFCVRQIVPSCSPPPLLPLLSHLDPLTPPTHCTHSVLSRVSPRPASCCSFEFDAISSQKREKPWLQV